MSRKYLDLLAVLGIVIPPWSAEAVLIAIIAYIAIVVKAGRGSVRIGRHGAHSYDPARTAFVHVAGSHQDATAAGNADKPSGMMVQCNRAGIILGRARSAESVARKAAQWKR